MNTKKFCNERIIIRSDMIAIFGKHLQQYLQLARITLNQSAAGIYITQQWHILPFPKKVCLY
jgi:hypothetical protein